MMRRCVTNARRVALLLAGFALVASAQEESRNSIRGSSFGELAICQSEGSASRTRSCEPEQAAPGQSETELTLPVQPPVRPAQCTARVATEYVQFDTLVNVEGTIEIEGCAVAAGQYTIAARVADEAGAVRTLEFTETWQRGNEAPVTFSADYPIGRNVRLLNLRTRAVRCACEE